VVRTLIVDDYEPFRAGAKALLELDGFEVVAEAGDGATGLALARDLDPELVLLDVQLGDMSGLEVAERLASEGPAMAVVLVSNRDPADFGKRLARSGALGFVPKDALSAQALQELLRSR
jgi:DNA-binding NarL/FixJ family response regulator